VKYEVTIFDKVDRETGTCGVWAEWQGEADDAQDAEQKAFDANPGVSMLPIGEIEIVEVEEDEDV